MNQHTRKRDEESRPAAVDHMRVVFDDALPAIAVCDPSGTLIEANKAFRALVSRTPKKMLGVRLSELIEPSDREELARQCAAVLSGAPAVQCEVSLLQRRGVTRRAVLRLTRTEAAGQPLLIVDGKVPDTGDSDTDARQALNAILAQVALEWTSTFDAVEIPIFMLDSDLRVRRMNRAAARTAGGEFLEILERRIDSLGPGDPWRTAARLTLRALEDGKPQTSEVHDEMTGTYWDVFASVANMNTPGDERIVVTTRNITAMHNLQESVRRGELLSALGSLVAGVAHEVRNPLFGISATIEAFAAEHREQVAIDEYLAAFRRDLRRLTQLMNDLLDYGKPSSPVLTRQPLAPVIQQAVSVTKALALQNDVTVVIDLPESIPEVYVEAERILIVFKNLVENAIAFSPRGSEVTITASLTTTNDTSFVSCSVADCGPGFSPADLKRVFEPFYSRRVGGTGFGLALVQRIVTDHGGTVTATNRRGAGAMMTVQLPVVTESQAKPPELTQGFVTIVA